MKFLNCVLLFTLTLLVSCNSSKNLVDSSSTIKNLSTKKIIRKHTTSKFDKKTINAKLKVDYKDAKEDVSFSVKMKIIKDEVIWLKGTKLITLFKAKITPDTVRFYSPYKKTYFESDFSMLKKFLGTDITFVQLQNLLLGEALLDINHKKYDSDISDLAYRLSPKEPSILFDILYWIHPQSFKLIKQSVRSSAADKRLDINYPSYKRTQGVIFPEQLHIHAKNGTQSTHIDIEIKSVTFDSELTMPFNLPQGYKEIQL